MRLQVFIFILMLSGAIKLFAQVGINSDNSAPNSSAMLDVKSTTKGFLPPRMSSAQMNAIASPAEGLMVYNTTIKSLCWYIGNDWIIGRNLDGRSCGTVTYGGKTYTSVIIGSQCWMKENLDIGIAVIGSQNQFNNGITEKYCYNNIASNCAVYGGLYQWDEMMQYVTTGGAQGICPAGWHIPADAEWTILSDYLGGEYLAGGRMKETGTTHWSAPNTGATNSSGFTALPGGVRDNLGTFGGLTFFAFFWSSSQYDASSGMFRAISWDEEFLYTSVESKSIGYSCRCLKD